MSKHESGDAPSMSQREMWLDWIAMAERYGNANLTDVRIQDGFPVEVGAVDLEYYFAQCRELTGDSAALLGDVQWLSFMDLCRRIRNGTISSLKIRDGRPVAGRGPLPARKVRRALEKILAVSGVRGQAASQLCVSRVDRNSPCPSGSGRSPAAAPQVRCPAGPDEGSPGKSIGPQTLSMEREPKIEPATADRRRP